MMFKFFFNEIILLKKRHKLHLSCLFCCKHTCYFLGMVSVTSASRYITSASHYHRVIKVDPDEHPWSDYMEFRGIGRGSSN